MESGIEKFIESSTNEVLVLIRLCVDKTLFKYKILVNQDQRNEIIINIFSLIQKKHVGPNNSSFELNKKSIIEQVVNSYIEHFS